jgi:hypothetical protein
MQAPVERLLFGCYRDLISKHPREENVKESAEIYIIAMR